MVVSPAHSIRQQTSPYRGSKVPTCGTQAERAMAPIVELRGSLWNIPGGGIRWLRGGGNLVSSSARRLRTIGGRGNVGNVGKWVDTPAQQQKRNAS